MSDDMKQKAENLKFLCKKKTCEPASQSIFGFSLRQASEYGVGALAIQEVAFNWYLLAGVYYGDIDLHYVYILLLSLIRLCVFCKFFKGVRSDDFAVCHKLYRKARKLTILQIFNALVVIIGAFFYADAGRIRLRPYYISTYLMVGVPFIALNVYILYMFYSFTKHLGLGNVEIINGVVAPNAIPLNVNLNTNYRNISVLTVGPVANAPADINSYPSFDKITLASPVDLSFAQSAQNAVISDVVLPSGVKVPSARDGKQWRIVGNEVLLL
jgi:hypothetical protein